MDEQINSIRPSDLRDYLKAEGWKQIPQAIEDGLYVLNGPEGIGRQVVFPTETSAVDYWDSISVSLEKLSDIYRQPISVLAGRIRNAKSDILHLRAITEEKKYSISFHSGSQLISAIERILRASAATALRPQQFHPRLGFSEATRLLESTRLEQTTAGSYVFNIACPVNAVETEATLFNHGDQGSFVRATYRVVDEAARKLVHSIQSGEVEKTLEEDERSGSPIISANLCEALAMIAETSYDSDLSFSWSGSIPRSPSMPIKVQSDYEPIFSRLSSSLRKQSTPTVEQYFGTVERLDGEIDESGRRSGQVIVAVLDSDESETIRVRIHLDADDYKIADRAHMTPNAYIKVKGLIRPGRQPRIMDNVSEFALAT